MENKSSWKEKAEKEISELLEKTFGKNNIQPNPKINNKRADFLVKTEGIFVEVYSVKDITSDIIKRTPHSPNVEYVEIPMEKVLDRLRGKILHECDQFLDRAKNVLVVKTEELFVSSYEVAGVFMEPKLLINIKTNEPIGIKYQSHFRTESEMNKVLRKISAIIAYDEVCPHGKLRGVFIDNKNNAKIPLTEKEHSIFEEMICDVCT